MSNFGLKINLMKLKRAGIITIQGKGEVLKCLVIPVEENNLFVSSNEQNKPKAVYLDVNAWELRTPKYEETHMLKQSLPKEVRERMSEEERNSQPILGGMKPFDFEQQNSAGFCEAPFAQVENYDDLPF